MAKITKEQVEEFLRRMNLNGANYIDIDVQLDSDSSGKTWVESISIDEYSESGKYLDTLMEIFIE